MKTLITSICILALCGCSFIDSVAPTPETKAVLIKTGASTAVVVGVEQLNDDAVKARVAYYLCNASEQILYVLNSEESIDQLGFEVLFSSVLDPSRIDPLLMVQINGALDLLLANIKFPSVDEVLDAQSRLYVTAFFEGVMEGSKIILNKYRDLVPESLRNTVGNNYDPAVTVANFHSLIEDIRSIEQ